ncbi:DUF5675 family protein [Winogradskyella sp.]|uniref:DUF5675 family protein n=1 Tax=Winogradskyella sp. TaxID=1883156 RepID=UPI0037041496
MRTIIVNRDWQDENQTLGVCYVKDEFGNIIFKSECIERGWRNNQSRVSCIPPGTYPVKLEYSPRFRKKLWEIYDVPGRSECKFHAANYARQLNGCIALGNNRKDIDNDGYYDVTSSRDTMKKFHEALQGFNLARLEVVDLHDN